MKEKAFRGSEGVQKRRAASQPASPSAALGAVPGPDRRVALAWLLGFLSCFAFKRVHTKLTFKPIPNAQFRGTERKGSLCPFQSRRYRPLSCLPESEPCRRCSVVAAFPRFPSCLPGPSVLCLNLLLLAE